MTAVPVWQTPAIRQILCRAASRYTQCGLSLLICIRYRKTYRPSMQFSKLTLSALSVSLRKTKSHTCAESIRKLSTLSTGRILHFSSFLNISPRCIHFIHTWFFSFYPYILQFSSGFSRNYPLNAGQDPIYPQSYPHYPHFPIISLTHRISPGCPQFYPQTEDGAVGHCRRFFVHAGVFCAAQSSAQNTCIFPSKYAIIKFQNKSLNQCARESRFSRRPAARAACLLSLRIHI